MDNTNILEIKTVQSNSIKTLVESLKEVLTDVNIYFDQTGMKIMTMDSARVSLVYTKLNAQNFEQYYCKDKVTIGINVLMLFKLLKTIGNNDILTIFVEEKKTNELGIMIENKEKNTTVKCYLKMLDINDERIDIPDIEYDSVISMPSTDFQKYTRDLSIISNSIIIESDDDKFTLSADGDFASQKIEIGETQNGLVFSKKNTNVKEVFDIKYINCFTKSTNLCSTVEIFLKRQFPLIVEYNVANLGKIQFCLAPKVSN